MKHNTKRASLARSDLQRARHLADWTLSRARLLQRRFTLPPRPHDHGPWTSLSSWAATRLINAENTASTAQCQISSRPTPVNTQDRQKTPSAPARGSKTSRPPRDRDPKGPLFCPAFGHDMDHVLATIAKIQEYDAEDGGILIILAHDTTFRSPQVPKFPQSLNDWKEKGLGRDLRWGVEG